MQTCKSCGESLQDGAKFCSSCGAKVEAAPPPPPEPTTCTACGAPLAKGAQFCTACGKAVVGAAVGGAAPLPKVTAGSDDWGPTMAFEPILTLRRALGMAHGGAICAGVVALTMLWVGLTQKGVASDLVMSAQMLFGLVYGACAYFIWKGKTPAALIAAALYAVNLFAGILILLRSNALAGEHIPSTQVFIWFLMLFVIPAGLISGVRGCLAIKKFGGP